MKTLELFCGTKSFSKVAASLGHRIFTIDNDPGFGADLTIDVRHWRPDNAHRFGLDVLWASPPCQGFSVAAIGRNWNKDRTPKTESARLSVELAERTLELIRWLKPKYWFIENPRAMLRKMPFMDDFLKETCGVRRTISYCQYGDRRMKPTDIYTNCLSWTPKPLCNRGDPCHEAAPRGSKTGTQGMKGAKERGVIPPDLFTEIFRCL